MKKLICVIALAISTMAIVGCGEVDNKSNNKSTQSIKEKKKAPTESKEIKALMDKTTKVSEIRVRHTGDISNERGNKTITDKQEISDIIKVFRSVKVNSTGDKYKKRLPTSSIQYYITYTDANNGLGNMMLVFPSDDHTILSLDGKYYDATFDKSLKTLNQLYDESTAEMTHIW